MGSQQSLLFLLSGVDSVVAPKSCVHALTPGTSECKGIWERVSADVIQLRTSRGDYLGFRVGCRCHERVPIRERQKEI